ncbi:MAG: hypothetical protein GQ581_08975 [Methyloprofundus sp.]|nr:hypothetical protein [Methyloprofundus sp.]
MTTAAIDLDMLNELLDNQKKLDDIFSSAFDDDSFLSSPMSPNKHELGKTGQKGSPSVQYNTETSVLTQQSRNTTYLVLPVLLEIAVIYYCIMNFS